MKPIPSRTRLLLVLALTNIVSGSVLYLLAKMPVAWYDVQGAELVSFLEAEFDLPMSSRDSRESIWHKGKAYLSLAGWKTGSEVRIYGLSDADTQNALLRRGGQLVTSNQWNDVWMYFYDSKAETSGAPPVWGERLSVVNARKQ